MKKMLPHVLVLLLSLVGLMEAAEVTVLGGSGSGSYIEGDRFFVIAADPAAGQVFSHWSGDTNYLGVDDSPITMLSVPPVDVAITAVYRSVGSEITVVDSAEYMNLYLSNQWIHVKYEHNMSGSSYVVTNTTVCIGEQLYNGIPAIGEYRYDSYDDTSYYNFINSAAILEGSYNSDNGGMAWADGNEILAMTNSFVDGISYNFTCAMAHDPSNPIPYVLRQFPGETITVPAGTYTCVRVQLWIPMFEWFSEEWYAPGVGKVKAHSSEIGNGEYIWELEKYSEGEGGPVDYPVEILTGILPEGIVGVDYESTLIATNGTAPYSWSASGLPAGLTISSGGMVSGLPTGAFSNTVLFTVTDNLGETNAASLIFVVPVDSDGDDLPDEWEFTRFGHISNCVATADVDGDGHSNYKEYLSGTNPTNKASVLAVQMTVSGTTNQLSWYGVTNHFYQLEYAEELTEEWLPVDYRVVEGANDMEIQLDAEIISNRFYRVKVSADNSVFPLPPLP